MHYIVYIFLIYFLIKSCMPAVFKIVSVTDAKTDEYPFIVRLESRITLQFNDKAVSEHVIHICSGVAISSTWTLTAGHCIDSAGPVKNDFNNLKVESVIRYGPHSGRTAAVISSILHPNYNDPFIKMHSDIGLLRTEEIQLNVFADISSIDINSLVNHEVTLAGHTNMTTSLTVQNATIAIPWTTLQLMKLFVVGIDDKEKESTLTTKCVSNRCVLSSAMNLCDEDSGGPLLHSTGVLGIHSMSLKKFQACSMSNGWVGMETITWTKLHIEWITKNIHWDLLTTKS